MEEAAAALLDQARCLHSPSSLALFVFTLLFTVLPEIVLQGCLTMAGFRTEGKRFGGTDHSTTQLAPTSLGQSDLPRAGCSIFYFQQSPAVIQCTEGGEQVSNPAPLPRAGV